MYALPVVKKTSLIFFNYAYIFIMYEINGESTDMRSADREKFVRLATKRVNNAIKAINLIGNLSNRSNYDYTAEDVAKIFKAIQGGVNACRKRFEIASKPGGKDVFTLD